MPKVEHQFGVEVHCGSVHFVVVSYEEVTKVNILGKVCQNKVYAGHNYGHQYLTEAK